MVLWSLSSLAKTSSRHHSVVSTGCAWKSQATERFPHGMLITQQYIHHTRYMESTN